MKARGPWQPGPWKKRTVRTLNIPALQGQCGRSGRTPLCTLAAYNRSGLSWRAVSAPSSKRSPPCPRSAENGRERLVDDVAAVLAEAEEMLKRAATGNGRQGPRPALAGRDAVPARQAQAAGVRRRGARPRQGRSPRHRRLRPRQSVAVDRHCRSRWPPDRLADESPLAMRAVTAGTPPRVRRDFRARLRSSPRRCSGSGRRASSSPRVEFEEARARTTQNLVLVMVAGLCFAFALLGPRCSSSSCSGTATGSLPSVALRSCTR